MFCRQIFFFCSFFIALVLPFHIFAGGVLSPVLGPVENNPLLDEATDRIDGVNSVKKHMQKIDDATDVGKHLKNGANHVIGKFYEPTQSTETDRKAESYKYGVALPEMYAQINAQGGVDKLVSVGLEQIDELEKKAKEQKEKNKSEKIDDLSDIKKIFDNEDDEPEMPEELVELVLENADEIRQKLELIAQLANSAPNTPFDALAAQDKIKNAKGLEVNIVIPTKIIASVWQQSANLHFARARFSYSVAEFQNGQNILNLVLWQLSARPQGFVAKVNLNPKQPASFGRSFLPDGCLQDADYKNSTGDHLGGAAHGVNCAVDWVPTPKSLLGALARGKKLKTALKAGMKDRARKRTLRDIKRVQEKIKEKEREALDKVADSLLGEDDIPSKKKKQPQNFSHDIDGDDLDNALERRYKNEMRRLREAQKIDEQCWRINKPEAQVCKNAKSKLNEHFEREKQLGF